MLAGPTSSPACGKARSPASRAMRKARANSRVSPRRSSLDSPKPTTPSSTYCDASRARVRASSGWRVRLAATTMPIPTPVVGGGVAGGVQHQLGHRGDAAELRGVAAGVDLELQPASAVTGVVLGRLGHQPAYVVLGAQHRPRDVVEPLEAEPALLVGRRQLGRPVLHERVGQQHPVPGRELHQRPVAHRPGEVQVQVGLRQRRQVAPLRRDHGPPAAQPKSFCRRLTPSTRSSSPSA